jgi:hypothetical protein
MNLPLTRDQVRKGALWLHANFAAEIAGTINGKPYQRRSCALLPARKPALSGSAGPLPLRLCCYLY